MIWSTHIMHVSRYTNYNYTQNNQQRHARECELMCKSEMWARNLMVVLNILKKDQYKHYTGLPVWV